jgi:hypothetical protein
MSIPKMAAIVFSIARNHLIGMTYGKMSPPSAARLPKTNHTGLLSEPKADCLGKSTSSSASGEENTKGNRQTRGILLLRIETNCDYDGDAGRPV